MAKASKAPILPYRGPPDESACNLFDLLCSRASFILCAAAIIFGVIGFYARDSWLSVVMLLLRDGLIVAGWVGSAALLGMKTLQLIHLARRDEWGALTFVTAAGLGLGIMSLAALGLGLAGWLNRVTVIALLLAGPAMFIQPMIAFARSGKHIPIGRWLAQPIAGQWLLLAACPAFAMMITGASIMPGVLWKPEDPHPYDVTEYHLEVPREWYQLGRIVPSGTVIGRFSESVANESGLPRLKVVASCSHDTGAAVAAVPAQGQGWAYLSSGTWSLMGVERRSPIVTAQCRDLNFTNEIGFGGSIRLLKNISGLWVIQECRRFWERQGYSLDYAALTQLAAEAVPFASLINPADPRFLAPTDMTVAISKFCHETGQKSPESPGEFARCAFESLALLYGSTRRQLEELTGEKIERLHIVGGGSRNELLNQFTADALQIPVIAGPVEATAAGNVLIQAIGLGQVESLEEAREIVRNSSAIRVVSPGGSGPWEEAAETFARISK